MKKLPVLLCAALYILAGVNHFWHPAFYLQIIPPYLPFHVAINYVSGFFEFVTGVLLLFPAYRNPAAKAIILLLILFIPAHIYTIQIACAENNFCNKIWLPLLRLIIGQPLLIAWAWWVKNYKTIGKLQKANVLPTL